jgi:pimeloyl-ACP methyl ester carboxylesterase
MHNNFTYEHFADELPRYYWDFAPGYSYVDVATTDNHATFVISAQTHFRSDNFIVLTALYSFFYGRLGVGQSSKPDALNVVQVPLEVEILQSLTTMVESGYFSNSTFSTVIGAGHSFGSVLTQAVTSKYPTSFNTAILTGFSMNSTG